MRDLVDVDALVEGTRRLVAIDSQNPPGREREVTDAARALLEPLGASFQEVEPVPGRPSLVALVAADGGSAPTGRPTLIVNGHLDTVPVDPSAWTRDPFGGQLEGGRLHGRGSADMKGGIVCAIEAVRLARLATGASGLPCDVVFHLVADEETGGRLGTKVLLDKGFIKGAACLDPEPTSMGVCIAERGLLQFSVTTRGVPAHASDPSRGVSAIEKAAHLVLALHGADYGEEHPLLGRPSSNVGMIAGGNAFNVVPEAAELKVDRRVLPGATEASTVETIHRCLAQGAPGVDYDLAVHVFGEASEMSADEPFLARFQAAYAAELGAAGQVIGMQFTTDARFVRNQAGIPAIVCGPGELDQAHRVDESVAIDAMVDATALYARLIADFANA